MTRGEPAVGTRDFALHPCIRLAPCWGRTMKQSFASAARLRGGGPILTNGSMTVFWLGSPPPRIVIGQPGKGGFRLACRNTARHPRDPDALHEQHLDRRFPGSTISEAGRSAAHVASFSPNALVP